MRKKSLLGAAFVLSALALIGCGASIQEQPESTSPQQKETAALHDGDKAPAFTLREASGRTVSLGEFRHRSVLLYFSMGPG